jgi:hypothetical protein
MDASRLGRKLALAWLLCGISGCAGADPESSRPGSASTGSTCPSGSTLTYDTWAQTFFSGYCTRCHSVNRTTQDERHGATVGANWDDLTSIREFADEIDAYAAAGPSAVNTIMPPSAPQPPEDERRRLGEWLACGAP